MSRRATRMRRTSPLSSALLMLLLVAAVPAAADDAPGIFGPRRVPPSALDELTEDGRPTAAAIAVLRSHARGRAVRLTVDDSVLVLRGAGFDPGGVTLAGGSAGDSPVRSPIPWSAIGGVETRHSYAVAGIFTGALLMAIAGGVVFRDAGSDPGPGILIIIAFPPAGAVIGGLVGARMPRWEHEWPPAAPRAGGTR